MVDYFILYHFF